MLVAHRSRPAESLIIATLGGSTPSRCAVSWSPGKHPATMISSNGGGSRRGLLAVSSGFGDQVDVILAWRVDEGVIVSSTA